MQCITCILLCMKFILCTGDKSFEIKEKHENRNVSDKNGIKCEYKFIVQELNTSECPIIKKANEQENNNNYQRDDSTSNNEADSNIMSNINGLQSQLIEEMKSIESINKQLLSENKEVSHLKEEVAKIRKMFKQVEDAVKKQEIFREKMKINLKDMDYKLSNTVLDIIEINDNLNKQYMVQNKKVIPVESSVKSTFCKENVNATKYTDCYDLYKKGHTKNGVYYISNIYTGCSIPVYCDMKTPPGGWTVIHKRFNGKQNFALKWNDYKNGFGNVTHEYWLGNDNIFLMASQKKYTLRVDLWDFKDSRVYAEYDHFIIDGARDNYTLHVGNYSGTAGDSLSKHDGTPFSTVDMDHDVWPDYNCADAWGGGWWFNDCWYVILNGPYYNGTDVEYRGISWNEWKHEQLKKAEMKIRPSY